MATQESSGCSDPDATTNAAVIEVVATILVILSCTPAPRTITKPVSLNKLFLSEPKGTQTLILSDFYLLFYHMQLLATW